MEGVLGAMYPARELEHLKIVKAPNLLGRVHLDNFVYLPFPLSSKLCNPCPLAKGFLVRKSLRLPTFLLFQSSQIWIPAFHKQLESQSLHKFCLS